MTPKGSLWRRAGMTLEWQHSQSNQTPPYAAREIQKRIRLEKSDLKPCDSKDILSCHSGGSY